MTRPAPIVTVPVEPTEAMIEAGMSKVTHGGVYLGLQRAYRAMLAAAPAAPQAAGVGEDYFYEGDVWEDQNIGRWVANIEEDGRAKAVLAAQAIGEDEDQAVARRALILSALRAQPPARAWGWECEICTGCSASLSDADIKAGGHVSCCPDRRMVTVRDLVDAYEAQRKPQAREDAQPVAWIDPEDLSFLATGNPLTTTLSPRAGEEFPAALYTHPAPDALRELELLEEVCARYADDEDAFLSDGGEPFGSITTECGMKARDARKRFRDRLAALQAEQKGGAA